MIYSKRLRDYLLYMTDWTQTGDNSLSEEEKEAWRTYRQALRDMNEDSNTNNWPVPPSQIKFALGFPVWLNANLQDAAHL